MSLITYPSLRRDNEKNQDFHGVVVPNPYQWLEDPDSNETKEFVKLQNNITDPILKDCPLQNKYKQRMTELWDYPKYGCPFRHGTRYFYYHNSGLQNQSVLYVQESLDALPEVFLDPNTFCEDGLQAISGLSFSKDGQTCAYGVSSKGSDWITVKFMNVITKEKLSDVLENVKFSCLEWTHDNKGLFYNRYAKDESKQDGTETSSNLNQKLYYHVIGDKQADDILVAETPEHPKWMIHAEVSDDGEYIILVVSEGCDPVNQLYFCDFKYLNYKITGLLPFVKIVDNFKAEYSYVTNTGSLFTFKTNLDAPKYKLINIDFNNYSQENWSTLVEEHTQDVLQWCACVNEKVLVMCYLHDVKNEIYLHHLNDGTRFKHLKIDVGTIGGYSGRKEDKEIFYSFTSFLTPGVIYHCDLSKDDVTPTVFRSTEVKGFDASLFTTHQVFFKSNDGTFIPMFIVHKKGIKLDSNNPCFLYGYGGFNISIKPSFSVSRLIFMQNMGGILAVANIRGGGEYGEDWHKDGSFGKKQNVFDDFISAAEYLIQMNYTNPDKMVINGGSNGGLLVTACMNQRPDLYKCVIAQVSVTDMLNFHKYTIGHAWITDFGCADKKEDFDYLYKYSPLHNVRIHEESQYPCLLLLTADHDDRVVPLHSFKLIAHLQHVLGNDPKQTNPLLIKIDTEAGHGFGKPTKKVIDETSDIYGFIAKMLHIDWLE